MISLQYRHDVPHIAMLFDAIIPPHATRRTTQQQAKRRSMVYNAVRHDAKVMPRNATPHYATQYHATKLAIFPTPCSGVYTDVTVVVTPAHVHGNLLCEQQGTLRIPATMTGTVDGTIATGPVGSLICPRQPSRTRPVLPCPALPRPTL